MAGKLTRRQAIKLGAAGLGLTAALGIAPKYIRRARAGLAPGMTGGPTGFEGAERYQYDESMSEGRAVEGIKRLRAIGKAPEKLAFLLPEQAIPQFITPFPEGAPSVHDVWRDETGIEIEFAAAPEGELISKVLQDIATEAGVYDIYTGYWGNVGGLVSLDGISRLDRWVDRHRPDWADPVRGVPSQAAANLLYKYAGSYYSVALEGAFQTWVYRKDLFEDAANIEAFGDDYGWRLGPPQTWRQVDQISGFFHSRGLDGHSNLMSPYWGLSTFYQRFVSQAAPNLHFFDEEGIPLLDTDLGIKAAEEHVESLKWTNKDALGWSRADAYASMASGAGVVMTADADFRKRLDRFTDEGEPASAVAGKLGSFLPVGNRIDSALVRRSVLYTNLNAEVAALSSYREAAFLFLQWITSTRIFSWMTGNPVSYFNPFQRANFADPLVRQAYHADTMAVLEETIKRSAPTINFPGQSAFDNSLDEQLQRALLGEISPAEAMKNAAQSWRKIVKEKDEDLMVEAIQKSRAAWPTIIDHT